jgi:large subunit ribosomal protein L17
MSRKHQAKLPKLNRNTHQRKALIRNLLKDLVVKGQLETTLVKAKVLKRHFDKLVTTAKKATLASRRAVAKVVGPKLANRLVDQYVPSLSDRSSGYTSIVKTYIRKGDATPLARVTVLGTPIEFTKPVKETKVKVKKAKPVTKKATK